jgi:phosphate transport system substrate-binding protein
MKFNRLSLALLAGTAIGGLAGTASAQSNSQINASAQSVVNGGGSSLAYPTYVQLYTSYSAGDSTIGWNWTSKGSGNAQCAFINNYETAFYTAAPAGSAVHLAASDGFLSAVQLDIYKNGYTGTGPQTGAANNCATTNQTITGPNITLTYPTTAPQALGGPLIQLPTFGTPITLAYNIDGVRPGNSRVKLTDDQLCGIFSGVITTFNDPRLSGSGLPSNANTIHVAYRSDGSGTSFLFTQHLKAVCTSANSTTAFANNLGTVAPTTSFAALFTTGGGTVPTNFTGASGSGGVVGVLGYPAGGNGSATAGVNAIGYLSPDFTSIAQGNKGTYLPVASVKNVNSGAFVLPDVAGTTAALRTATPPSGSNLSNPDAYIPRIPSPTTGYPIVGYTTYDLVQCYKDANLAGGLVAYLTNLYSLSTNTLGLSGFAVLPDNLFQPINDNILNNNGGLNLDIENPTVCQAAGASGPGTYPGR